MGKENPSFLWQQIRADQIYYRKCGSGLTRNLTTEEINNKLLLSRDNCNKLSYGIKSCET